MLRTPIFDEILWIPTGLQNSSPPGWDLIKKMRSPQPLTFSTLGAGFLKRRGDNALFAGLTGKPIIQKPDCEGSNNLR